MLDDKLTHIDLFSGIPPGDSPSPRDGQDSAQSPSVKSTPSARKSSKSDSEQPLKTIGDKLHSRESPLPDCAGNTTTPLRLDGCANLLADDSSSVLPRKKSSRQGSGLLVTPQSRDHFNPQGQAYKTGHMDLPGQIQFLSPTSSPSTAPDSEEQLCLPGASPASLSVTPGSDEARKILVRSGLKCLESSMRQGPLGSLERMLAASSAWNSTRCLLIWKWKATPQGRSILELSASTPRTAGCESGLLHTPSGQEPGVDAERLETKEGSPAKIGERAYDKTTGRLAQVGLPQQISMLRTPCARDYHPHGQWGREGRQVQVLLAHQIAMLPTPLTISDNPSAHNKTNGEWQLKINKAMAGVSRGLKLQPAFVEWMMGYPLGFTHVESPDSKPSATPLSRKSHTKSSKQSRKSKGE